MNLGERPPKSPTPTRSARSPVTWRGALFFGVLAGCLPYGRAPRAKPALPAPPAYASQTAHVSEAGAEDSPPAPRRTPEREEPARPSQAVQPAGLRPTRDAGRWWEDFDDAALSALIEEALQANLDLRVAWERVQQAQALSTQASAARWPQIGAQGDVTWSRAPFALAGAGANADQLNVRGSVPVSYEVDWFARNAGRAEAAKLDLAAARSDAQAAAITVSAQVAESWFDLVEARARVDILRAQLSLNERFLELTTLRFRQGLSTAVDAHQQRQQVAATHAQAALAEARERVSANQLAIMLGKSPEGDVYATERRGLPTLPERPEAGVPMDLLVARPDVRASARRVEAADERVAVAIAGRLPSLTINGSPGYSFARLDAPGFGTRTTHGPAYNLGAQLNIPLFDGFQRKAEVNLSRARTREALESYTSVLQRAVAEVDSAIASERSQDDHIRALEEQLQAAEDTLDSARERYRQGLSDFLPVLQALTAMQQTELTLLSARRQQLAFRVQLHRALGGSWTRDLPAPPARKGNDE